MSKNCCALIPGSRMVMSCSGASNLGQIGNALAIKLQHCGMAQINCLAALAAEIPEYIDSAESTEDLLIIDGCSTACGKKLLDKNGIKYYRHYVIADMLPGLEKEKRYDQIEEELSRIWKDFVDEL